VKLLLAKGADVNAMGEGETARSLAAKRGDTEVARVLGVSAEERKQGGVAPLPAVSPARSIPEAVQMALGRLADQSPSKMQRSKSLKSKGTRSRPVGNSSSRQAATAVVGSEEARLLRWPPSAAQTVRADFRHTAFTKTPSGEGGIAGKESVRSG
jgi:hypothetical protein